jgi:histidinol-phosphate aminotransferase
MIVPNDHLLAIDRVTENMGERAHYICLDRNERVTPWKDDVFRDMLASLRPGHFCSYPDPLPLYQRLSASLCIPENYLYLTNGSDAAIRTTFQTFVHSGDMVLQPEPTYAMYPIYTRIFNANVCAIPYDESLRLSVDCVLEKLKLRPRILAIANPDQPTGAVLSEGQLRRLADAAIKADTLFVIDEAYYPFYPHTAVALVREYPNIVVTRTFSKFGGLAGLRLGYLVADPNVIKQLQRVRGAHEVNAMAIAIGSYVLDHPQLLQIGLDDTEAGRRVLLDAAEEICVELPTCPTNFQLLRLRGIENTSQVVAALKRKGYLVKGEFAHKCIANCIRVTLAGPNLMEGFLTALRAVAKEIPWARN